MTSKPATFQHLRSPSPSLSPPATGAQKALSRPGIIRSLIRIVKKNLEASDLLEMMILLLFFVLFFKIPTWRYVYRFSERKEGGGREGGRDRERKRDRETDINRLLRVCSLTRDQTRNLGMSPGQEANWQPIGALDDAATNWASWPGLFKFHIYWFLEREEGAVREKERLIFCFTYLFLHWLILVCALTGTRTWNLDVSGWCYNQLSYWDRAEMIILHDDRKLTSKGFFTDKLAHCHFGEVETSND